MAAGLQQLFYRVLVWQYVLWLSHLASANGSPFLPASLYPLTVLPARSHDVFVDKGECISDPCQNGATCVDRTDRYVCQCAPGWEGTNCDINIDECASGPCQNNATCHDWVNYYTCNCTSGWEGTHCEINTDECASSPCLNSAACRDRVNYYLCDCAPGYHGIQCEEDTDECASDPCLNSATCLDWVNYYSCECADGWSGTHCEKDINECASYPCRNGSTCHDHLNGYTCECESGWEGVHCDIDIDECLSDPCQNQGRCLDIVNGYGCFCRYGWIGTQCGISNFCASNPCQHDGTCRDEPPGYTCECREGWTGRNCEEFIDRPCPTNICENDGHCIMVPEGFRCLCYRGWTGTYCEKVFLGENVEVDWQLGESITRGNWSAGNEDYLIQDCRQSDRFPFRTYNQCLRPGDGGQAISNEAAHSGNFSWHFKRGYSSLGAGTPFSASLNTWAGRKDGEYTAGADSFYASFFFKLANNKLDESRIAVMAGNPHGDERASNYLEIYAEPEQRVSGARFKGLHVRVADSYPDYAYCSLYKNCTSGHFYYIAENLTISEWHRIEMTLHAKPVDYFDEWHYLVDQKYNFSGGAYFQTERYDKGWPYEYVNRLKFQPRHDNYKKKYLGFFFDDVYYKAFDAEERFDTIEEYGTSFEEVILP
ncbi:uncharacterized protein LOC144927365 [Branchiostoma floridae x Branchiostoma belcheri]